MTAATPDIPAAGARVLAIVGPTAVGKTAVAEAVAVHLGSEIVSADSMQVYRCMDIGTAKPAPAERLVPYHCLDLVDPGEEFSAALFQRHARVAIAEISARGLIPVLAGGTGLYVRAALDDMRFPAGETAENPVRERYEALAAEKGSQALWELLRDRDPTSAELIHPNNTRRVVRAFEMLELDGTSYAEQRQGFSARESVYDATIVGLTMEREALYRRIERRVDAMIAAGLLGEVEALLHAGFREALTANQAIGYKELVGVVEGRESLDEAVELIKRATRRYAKRQLTWFRADPRVIWVDVSDASAEDAVGAVLAALDCAHG